MPEDRTWRELYEALKAAGQYTRMADMYAERAAPEEDALGNMVVDEHWQRYAESWRLRGERVLTTAEGMEAFGFPNSEIVFYVTSGWESMTKQMDMDMFQDLMQELGGLLKKNRKLKRVLKRISV